MKTIISTPKAPAAIGPYSQGVLSGGFLFLSGQIPINPADGEVIQDDIKSQTRQVLENIKNILEAAEMAMEDVVKATVFIKDIKNFQMVNEIYGEFFPQNPPARSLVEVSRLPKDVLIEVEVIARKH